MAFPTTVGGGGFPTVTRMFRRCNASHRIKGWDTGTESWTALRHRRVGRTRAVPRLALVPTPPVTPTADDAGFGRRVVAFLVDWVLASLVTFLVLPYDLVLDPGREPRILLGIPESSWAVLGVFLAFNLLLVPVVGGTVGHRVTGLQVWQVRPGVFALQVLVRSLLACLFLPGLIRAGDGRLLHDHLAGTRIVRPR